MENRIKVMVFEPLKEPYIENIKNVPEAYKSIVEGETEEVRLDEKTLLICNSEGKEKELVPNRTIGNDIICGTFFLATDTGNDRYASITPMQAQFYNKRYGDAEVISQADVKYLSQIGSVGIGRDTVYLNNLSMRFNEEKLGNTTSRIIGGTLAEIEMILGYFVFEGFMYGFAPSVVNIPANGVQGIAGLVIGIILVTIFDKTKMF